MIAMRSHFAQRILVGFFVVAALAIPAKSASASDPNYEPHNTAAIVYYLSQPNGWETYHALNTTAYLSQQFIAPELRVQITKIGTRLVRIGRKVREEAEKRNDGEATFQLMLGDKEKYLQLVKAEAAAFTNAESPISIRDIFDAIARAFCQVELETMSFELHQARAARRAESHGDAAASSSADPLFASSATAPFKVSVGALRSLIGGAESLQGFEPVARAVLQEGTAYRAPSRPDVQLLLEVNPDYAKLPLVNELLKPYERDNPPEDAVAQNAIEALASIQIVLPDYESRVIRKPPANDAQRDSEGEQTKVDRYRANQKVRNQSYDVLATYLFVWGEVFNSRSEARKAAELVALTKEFHLMYDGIEAFTLLGDAGKIDLTSAMLMQANTAIFAAKFASVFLSASHPSDLEIILEAMEKMRSQMHERFDRVEDILFALDEKFETRFQEIHKALRLGLSLQVAAISKIDEVNTRISELRREVLERLQLARVRAALKARDDVVRKVVKVRYDNVVTPSLFGHVADPGQVEAAVGDILEFIETELAHKDAIDIAVNTALLDDSVQLSEQVAAMLQQGAMPSVDNTLRLGQALAAGRKIEAQGGQPQDVELGANERVPDGDLAIAAADVLVELYIRHYDDPLPIKPLEAAIKSHEKVILFLGTGFERKGLSSLIQAFAIIQNDYPDTKLIVVGKDNTTQKYVHFSEKLNLSGSVIFTGPQSDVKTLYAAADIFVLPTLYEPFGNVCLEAMASGLPVITSRANGVSEIMEGMDYLLLNNPGDIEDMAGKIRFLLANNTEREKFSLAARRIAEYYTISRNAQQFIHLYQIILRCDV